jgi:6-phosphogluconolactonase
MAPQALDGCPVSMAACVALCLIGGLGWFAAGASPAAAEDKLAVGGAEKPGKLLVYIGGRNRGRGGAIWLSRLDLATGAMAKPEVAVELVNPSFQVVHPSGRFLYSVCEAGQFAGKKGGGVSALAIDRATGKLTLLNQQPSGGGAWPCHLTVDRAGKFVLGANYGGGSVFALPIGADGRLGEQTGFVQHTGRGADPKRQAAPHAHSINLDAGNRFAFAADLGLDKILVYRLDAAKGTLTPNDPPFVATAPGAGPRHFTFHPDGKWAYVINELNSTLTAFAYDADTGVLKPVQTLPTLPADYKGNNSCAEVQVHPSGKFLYGSNRGHESIAMFAIDPATGKLRSLGHELTRGKHPRNFRLDPTGTYLLAANRNSDNVVVFRIDAATGVLTATGHSISVPGPNCVKMLRLTP